MYKKKTIKTLRNLLIFCISILCCIGLIFVYSSSSVYALERYGSASYFVMKYVSGLILGIFFAICIQYIPKDTIKKYAPLSFFIALVATVLTLVPGFAHKIHGSQRWLSLAGFSFQPSELLKPTLILYIAFLLTESKTYHRFSNSRYIRLMVILGFMSIVLLKQPDFGLTITLIATICIMLFISDFYTKQLAITMATLLPITFFLILLKPYRLQRIITFLHPWDDPQGSGFQIIQSLIAIGSGGIHGLGISNSKQKFFYLPMQHTDFIFSIIAEETGFIGSCFVVTLYSFLLYIGLRLAWQLNDPFSSYATIGCIILIHIQATINLCVATGLAPTKGIGLPFISYGNTALVCSLCMIGLIINFTQHALHKTS